MENIDHPLLHWIPYKLINKDGELYFEWIYLGEQRYLDPFFEDSIVKCKSHPYNSKMLKVVSTVENLIDWSAQLASTNLKAFVFHISRCGSTMLAQSLAVSPQNVVVAEAPIIDEILRSQAFDLEKKRILIKAIIALLGQKRFPEEKEMIIKLDSWHIFEAAELRILFPNLPFVLLYRNPVEVLKSHSKLKGMHMVSGILPASIFGIKEEENQNSNVHQYGVLVLEKYFEAYLKLDAKEQNISIFNYNEGMKSILERFINLVDSDYYIEEIDLMYERLKTHSKNEKSAFTGDSFTNLDQAIDVTKVVDLYEKLDLKILGELAGRN
ncbi:hypothetical protein EV144_10374 [Flavobacterium sp. 270]|uniref:sulfotransferase family protein n=1 Tax=Flavobacterium sp. 270 TaxID=2512114 RepID=UPI00106530B6|nr:sulfotransferase family protein [Flavobacterium sp. 270]TDW48565.1 hypothetical protein EV144_10374 [Flavobacterium sp. 270]